MNRSIFRAAVLGAGLTVSGCGGGTLWEDLGIAAENTARFGAPLVLDYLAAKGSISDEARVAGNLAAGAAVDLLARSGAYRSAAWWAEQDQAIRDQILNDLLANVERDGTDAIEDGGDDGS